MGNGKPAPTPASGPTPAPAPAPAPSPTSTSAPVPSPCETFTSATTDPATQRPTSNVGSPISSCGTPHPSPAPAPTTTPLMAHIAVHVQDPSGKPIKGVDVTVLGQGWNGMTDANGNFDFGDRSP